MSLESISYALDAKLLVIIHSYSMNFPFTILTGAGSRNGIQTI